QGNLSSSPGKEIDIRAGHLSHVIVKDFSQVSFFPNYFWYTVDYLSHRATCRFSPLKSFKVYDINRTVKKLLFNFSEEFEKIAVPWDHNGN
ncbi:MAG: hypothetical protein QF713_03515, partial [Dehalococcoidales bacterium]|nr:hypothetical protein [Dehalococcoidales bacterium]